MEVPTDSQNKAVQKSAGNLCRKYSDIVSMESKKQELAI